MPILPRTKHQRSRGARRGVGVICIFQFPLRNTEAGVDARLRHVHTRVLSTFPRAYARVCCANQTSWRGENVNVGDTSVQGSRIIIRVKGNSARFGIDRWNGAWCRANRPLFHRSINNFVSRATRWRKLERLHAF